MTRSLRRRPSRRGVSSYVWLPIPVIHPYSERLKRAAVGNDVCWLFPVTVKETR